MTDAAALNDHGVGADEHVVLHDDGGGGGRLHHAGQYCACAHVAIFAHGGPAAQHRAHVDHGALADHRTDVDDRAHHDDGVFTDLHLLPDDGARLDAGGDVLQVQHGDGGIAAATLDFHMVKFIGFQHGLYVLPVAEDNFAALACGELPAVREGNGGLLPDVDLYRGLFFGGADVFNDFLCVHIAISLFRITQKFYHYLGKMTRRKLTGRELCLIIVPKKGAWT